MNRDSVGVQSFNDEILTNCNLLHRSKDIYKAIEEIKSVGISNYSINLISSLPYNYLEKRIESYTFIDL